jgi:hypothetical protein
VLKDVVLNFGMLKAAARTVITNSLHWATPHLLLLQREEHRVDRILTSASNGRETEDEVRSKHGEGRECSIRCKYVRCEFASFFLLKWNDCMNDCMNEWLINECELGHEKELNCSGTRTDKNRREF